MQTFRMQIFQASRLTSSSRVACTLNKNANVSQRRYRNCQCRAAKDAGKLLRDGKSNISRSQKIFKYYPFLYRSSANY